MIGKQFLFYAVTEELKKTLENIESKEKIKYVESGSIDTLERVCYYTYSEIPNLGISNNGNITGQHSYLVTTVNNDFHITSIPQRKGGIMYCADFSNNPSSITFTPSGEYMNCCLIYGMVWCYEKENELSQYLYKLFFDQFKKGFKSIKSFRVSTEAEKLLDKGFKLTANHKSSPEMDLSK
jgi:hypothetical protein